MPDELDKGSQKAPAVAPAARSAPPESSGPADEPNDALGPPPEPIVLDDDGGDDGDAGGGDDPDEGGEGDLDDDDAASALFNAEALSTAYIETLTDAAKPNVGPVAASFIRFIADSGWTPSTMPPDAAEQFLNATRRSALTIMFVRMLLKAGPQLGVDFAPQTFQSPPPRQQSAKAAAKAEAKAAAKAEAKAAKAAAKAEAKAAKAATKAARAKAAKAAKKEAKMADPNTAAAIDPMAAATVAAASSSRRPGRPAAASTAPLSSPAHVGAPSVKYVVEVISDGTIQGVPPGNRVPVSVYSHEDVAVHGSMRDFLAAVVAPGLKYLRPGSVASFACAEQDERSRETGRRWVEHVPVSAPQSPPAFDAYGRPVPAGYAAPLAPTLAGPPGYAPGYAPPQGYASPQPGYASPQGYALPQGYAPPQPGYAPPQPGYASPQPGYYPRNPIEEAAGTSYVEMMKGELERLNTLRSEQRRQNEDLAGGNGQQLVWLNQIADHRYEAAMARVDSRLREIQSQQAIVVPPAAYPPMPIAPPRSDLEQKILERALARMMDGDSGGSAKESALSSALRELREAGVIGQRGGEGPQMDEIRGLKAELAQLRDRKDLDLKLAHLEDELKKVAAGGSGNVKSQLGELKDIMGFAHDIAGGGKDDSSDDLLALALKNPAGASTLLMTLVSMFQKDPKRAKEYIRGAAGVAGGVPEVEVEEEEEPEREVNLPSRVAAPALAPQPVQQRQPAPAPAPAPQPHPAQQARAAPILPPSDSTTAARMLERLPADREQEIGAALLQLLTGYTQSTNQLHQQIGQYLIGMLREVRVYPDLYQVVKRTLSTALAGEPPKHAVVEKVATVMHDNWPELSRFLFGQVIELDDVEPAVAPAASMPNGADVTPNGADAAPVAEAAPSIR